VNSGCQRALTLLEEEKQLTRRSDEVARRRQELPWVRVDTDDDLVRVHVRDGRDADARRLDNVDDVDADANTAGASVSTAAPAAAI
jgi:hypothetical protein